MTEQRNKQLSTKYSLSTNLAITDPALVKTSAWLSLISYYPQDELKHLIQEEFSIPEEDISYFNVDARKANTDFVIFNTNDCIVLAFSGSKPSSFKDWITTDFDHDLTSAFGMGYGDIKVHSGFLNALNSCWEKINAELIKRWKLISKNNAASPMVLITGHSLGGALANLTAATIARQTQKPSDLSITKMMTEILRAIKVQTFGQPRVGDQNFKKWYNKIQGLSKNTLRHVNHYDVVPCLPPREEMLWFRFFDAGWEHVGQQWLYSHDGQVDKTTKSRDFPDLFFGGMPKPITWTCSVIDHMPWRYLWVAEGLEGKPDVQRRIEEAVFFSRFASTAMGRLLKLKYTSLIKAPKLLFGSEHSKAS